MPAASVQCAIPSMFILLIVTQYQSKFPRHAGGLQQPYNSSFMDATLSLFVNNIFKNWTLKQSDLKDSLGTIHDNNPYYFSFLEKKT